jgi:hypothetical protein
MDDCTYFSQEVLSDLLWRRDHELALTLHRYAGWRIGILWVNGDRYSFPYHVFAVTREGQAIDAEGARSLGELHERWTIRAANFPGIDRVTICETEADYQREMRDFTDKWLTFPGQRRTEKRIAASPAFTALVDSLDDCIASMAG